VGTVNRSSARQLAGLRLESAGVRGVLRAGGDAGVIAERDPPDGYEKALAQPHARPMDFTGRPLAGMVYVDPAGYKTDAALAKWVQRSVDFVSGLPAKKSAAARPRKRPAKG
jgi:hypothetical protein